MPARMPEMALSGKTSTNRETRASCGVLACARWLGNSARVAWVIQPIGCSCFNPRAATLAARPLQRPLTCLLHPARNADGSR